MKYCLILCFIFITSCSSLNEEKSITQKVTFELVSSKKGVAVLGMKNVSSHVLSYEHWFGQEGMPVAYCENDVGEIQVCSTHVFLLEDEYFTHETYIQPGDEIRFEANVATYERVGVKFYMQNNGFEEFFLWYQFK